MNIIYKLDSYNRIFKPINFIYSMSFYHVLVALFMLIGIEYNYKVFFVLDFSTATVSHLNDNILKSGIMNILFSLSILVVDFIFLIIIMFEFKQLKLTLKKISIIEVIIFFIALSNPYLRMIMLFLSLNTLAITIFYKIMKNVPYTNYIIVTGSYIIIIKLLLFPVFDYLKFIGVL